MLRRVGRRVAGALLAVLLGLAPTAAIAAQQRAVSCCCKHKGEPKCHCPVCTHARELQEGHASLKTCGSGEDAQAAAWSPAPFPPPASAAVARVAPSARPADPPRLLHEAPDLEPKTPPPVS